MNFSLSNPTSRSHHWPSIFVVLTGSLFIAGCATQQASPVSTSQSTSIAPANEAANEAADGDLSLVLNFKNVPDIPGSLMIAVYDDADSFRKNPYKSLKMPSTPGEMQVEVPGLSTGEYAVMVFHDQNGDGKLNRNAFGIPQEYWSGSLNTTFVLGAPSWKQTRFTLQKSGKSVQINF